MITVKIDNDAALTLLMNRLNVWTDDEDELALFGEMYENYIEGGCFDGCDFDVMSIVDNDWITNCSILHENDLSESDFEKLTRLGVGDVSCESFDYGDISFVEAMNPDKGLILIRW